MKITVLHGPNLNLLGTREPEVYGSETLAEIDAALEVYGKSIGVALTCLQFQSEGDLIRAIHDAADSDGVVINPGGYTHTSVALRDAISAVKTPCVEVHLSNLYAREEFRHRSLTGGACVGVVMGFGAHSYRVALDALIAFVKRSAP